MLDVPLRIADNSTIAIYEMEFDENAPNWEFGEKSAHALIPAKRFFDLIKLTMSRSPASNDVIQFIIDTESVKFFIGEETNYSSTIMIGSGQCKITFQNPAKAEPLSLLFQSKYLSRLEKLSKICQFVELSFQSESPLRLVFNTDKFSIVSYVMPKIAND